MVSDFWKNNPHRVPADVAFSVACLFENGGSGQNYYVYHNPKSVNKKMYGQDATNIDDGGRFAPNFQENKEGLEPLKTAIAKAEYMGKVFIGMVVDASKLYSEKDHTYDLNFKEENNNDSQKVSRDTLKNVYKSIVSECPMVSIKEPFDQDDWANYATMTDLLEVNQIRSVTESIEAVETSKDAGWGVITSLRSGRTEDTVIGDLGCVLHQPKGHRIAKSNAGTLASLSGKFRMTNSLEDKANFKGMEYYVYTSIRLLAMV